MSYDLVVFDAAVAPRDRAEFLDWYETQTEWDLPQPYDDPATCTPALRAWFIEIIKEFAARNGPYAPDELPDDIGQSADYSIASGLIYIAFSWSRTEAAYEATFRLASKHGVGFFNVSSKDSEVWVPGTPGELVLAHSG